MFGNAVEAVRNTLWPLLVVNVATTRITTVELEMAITDKECEAGAVAALSLVLGSLLYGFRLLMTDDPMPRRRAIGSIGVSGILSACGQTIAHEAVKASYPMSVAVGLLVGFLGGAFWIVLLERLARGRLRALEGAGEENG